MIIHELDEIDDLIARSSLGTPDVVAARRLVPRHITDSILRRADEIHRAHSEADRTAVRIELPSKSGGAIFAECVVVHNGDDVIGVRLPDGHGALAEAAGITLDAATEWEGYLCILARIAFARGGR